MPLKSALVWSTAKGKELLRVVENGTVATVIPYELNEADLRELSRCAIEAADQLAAFQEGGNDARG